MLSHTKMIASVNERLESFRSLSGIPLAGSDNWTLAWITRAYAAYRMKNDKDAIVYLSRALPACVDEDTRQYFSCINKYLELRCQGIAEEKIKSILYKFFKSEYADRLYEKLDHGQTPYDDYLMRCHFTECETCKYAPVCSFADMKAVNEKIGQIYSTFTEGQSPAQFEI